MPVVLYGPAYSTYRRTARLALEYRRHTAPPLTGAACDLREVDTLAGEGQKAEHRAPSLGQGPGLGA